jgi:hypothetical protein
VADTEKNSRPIDFRLYDVSPTLLGALRFIDSPLVKVEEIFRDMALAPQGRESISVDEQHQTLVSRFNQEIFPDLEKLHLTIFCFVTPPDELRKLMDCSKEAFREAATLAILGPVHRIAMARLFDACGTHFMNSLVETVVKGRTSREGK